MYPLYDTFHRLTTPDSPTLVFARLLPDALQVLKGDEAFVGRTCNKRVRGASVPVSDTLLSILLTSPFTKAQLNSGNVLKVPSVDNNDHATTLVLEQTDARNLTLQLTLPLLSTSASPILADLHLSLLTAVAALEGMLLATNSDDADVQIAADEMASQHGTMSLATLTALHAPPKPTGEPLSKIPTFRRVAAASDAFIAARGFAVATQAAAIRKDVFHRRQARLEEERRRRQNERRIAREAVNRQIHIPLVPTGAAALFDDSSPEKMPDPKTVAGQPVVDGHDSRSADNREQMDMLSTCEPGNVSVIEAGQGRRSEEQEHIEKNPAASAVPGREDDIVRPGGEQLKSSTVEHAEGNISGDVQVGSQNSGTTKHGDGQDFKSVKPKKKKRKVARLV